MKMVVAILVFSSLSAQTVQISSEVIANVSLLLAHYHSVDCLQIFRTENITLQQMNKIFKVWKRLANVDSVITTGVYSYKRYLERKLAKRRKVSCYRSLKVMSDDEGSKRGYAAFSLQVSLKDAIWVLFTESFSASFFEDAHVVFNDLIIVAQIMSDEVVQFHEVYKVTDQFPLKVFSLGNWTKAKGLALKNQSLYERRSDLEGINLRTASVQNWPASYRRRSTGQWDGFLVKLWQEIRSLINCTSTYVSGENLVGIKLKNQSWNGLVGMAMRNEIDVIVAEVVLDKERSHVLNFLHPIMTSNFQIYTRHLGYEWKWAAILKPLDVSVWAAAVGWIAVGTIFWALFHRICHSYKMESLEWLKDAPLNSFFFVTQAMCQQGYHISPRSFACRFLFFVTYAISSVLIPSYSASLVSTLSQKVHFRSFDSLQEMVEDGSYHLLVKENTAQHTFFAHSKNSFFKLAYQKLVKPVPEEMKKLSIRESIRTLCISDKYAVMGIEDMIEGRMNHLMALDCPIVSLTHPVSIVYITMATAKENPFWGLINYQLSKLLKSGAVERWRRLEFPPRQKPPKESQLQVGLRHVALAFIIIAFCTFVSAFILIIEIRYSSSKIQKAKEKRKQRALKVDISTLHFELKMRQFASKNPQIASSVVLLN